MRWQLNRLDDRVVPSGVPTSWAVRGAGGGGALFSPQINPANPSEYFVASDMGQVFRSGSGGDSWATIDYRELQGGHESRVQFSGSVRYTIDYSGDAPKPTKSLDGGTVWTPTTDPTGGGAYYLFSDPTNPQRLAVSSYFTLYLSLDGGTTWSAKHTTSNGAGLLLGGAFWDGTTITFGTNLGLLTSTNGGSSFTLQTHTGIPSTQAVVSFAAGKSGGTTRFLAVTLPVADVYAGVAGYDNGGGGQVYTSTGGTWTLQTLPSGTNPFAAGMARTDANVMYVAGGNSSGTPTVVKSTGGTWSNVFNTTNNANITTGWSGQGGDRGWGYGELAMGFTVCETDPNRLIITDYGFAHSSTDGGATWNALYVNPADRNPAGGSIPAGKGYRDSGLDNTTSWQVAWSGNNVVIANSDIRGQLSTDGGTKFGFGYSGHTQNSLYRVAKSGSALFGGTGTVHDLYQSTYLADSKIDGGDGGVIMSTNNGASWTEIRDFNDVVSWVAVDPNNANRVYASVVNGTSGGIWVSSNANLGTGSSWTKLANPPRTEGHPFNIVVLNDGTLVASYSGRRNSSGTFTASSGVFVSTDGGGTWADRSATGMRYWTKDVVVDPHDATQNTWYAGVFSGWGGPPNGLGGLYKTTDRGVTWTRILNVDRVTSCTFNTFDANELFVTTEGNGLLYSNNIRAATPTFTGVASYPFRQPERVFFNPNNANEIWVTSFGGGVMVGTNNPAPPTTVTNLSINSGSAQRSRVTTLDVTLSAAGSVGTVVLTRGDGVQVRSDATSGGRVNITSLSPTVVRLTFDNVGGTATSSGVEHGSLSDGRWTLSIASLNYTANLHRFFGDSNGDATVDGGSDFSNFGLVFGKSVPSEFDFNGDGVIDGGTDFAQFGIRFGKTV